MGNTLNVKVYATDAVDVIGRVSPTGAVRAEVAMACKVLRT